MALQSINPTETKTWAKLKVHFETIKDQHMKTWFAKTQAVQMNSPYNGTIFMLIFQKTESILKP